MNTKVNVNVDDLIVSDLESNSLPSRDSAGKRVFSNGEEAVLRGHYNEVQNMSIEIADAKNEESALEAKVPIVQQALADRINQFDAEKDALDKDIANVNNELSTKQTQLNALDSKGNNSTFQSNALTVIKDLGISFFEEGILLASTFTMMSYAFSIRTILLRSTIVLGIGVLSGFLDLRYKKHGMKSILKMYMVSMLMGFFALISAILACYVIKSEAPAASSFSLNLASVATEQVSHAKGLLPLLKEIWLSMPGLFAMILSFAMYVASSIVTAHKSEKSTVSASAIDRLKSSLKREISILTKKKDNVMRNKKHLDATYQADCNFLNRELEQLKYDILSSKKKAENAINKLTETYVMLSAEIQRYDSELKSLYEVYWNKDMQGVSTTAQDIEHYYNTSI